MFYLKVLLPVERNRFGFDLSVLDIDLVADQYDGDIFTDPHEIAMPIRHVLVGYATRDVEHDNRALALNIIAVTKPTEFLLASCVPDVETDFAASCVKLQRMDFDSQSR